MQILTFNAVIRSLAFHAVIIIAFQAQPSHAFLVSILRTLGNASVRLIQVIIDWTLQAFG